MNHKIKKVKTTVQKGSVPSREAFLEVPKLIRIDNSYQPNSYFKETVESLFEDLRKPPVCSPAIQVPKSKHEQANVLRDSKVRAPRGFECLYRNWNGYF